MIKSHSNKRPKEQVMKIVFVTSIVIVLLRAIGIFGIDNNSVLENTFAQEGNLEIPLSVKLDGNISTMKHHQQQYQQISLNLLVVYQ